MVKAKQDFWNIQNSCPNEKKNNENIMIKYNFLLSKTSLSTV